ncbi:MAG TPA: response regulator [Chthoniobacterales bacterium]|jgi:PAS domain S-box-containing protein|nr:response regulator [Chthoniobacterales bacterium]
MATPLRVLIVEDQPSDAELLLRELRRAGYEPQWKRVFAEEDFLPELEADYDIILSDYSMPRFDGIRALRLLNECGSQIPFILVSGTMGEETAVAAMKEGATDYLLKDRLARLGPAVSQALAQRELRKEGARAEESIRLSQERFSLFMDNLPGFAWIKDNERRYVYANKSLRQMVMRGRDWFGKTAADISPELAAVYESSDREVIETRSPTETVEPILEGEEQRTVLASKFPILDIEGQVSFICGIGIDITERVQAQQRIREQAEIINRAHDAIIARDFESQRITFWNKGAENLYGWTAEEAVGRPIGELIFADPKELEPLTKTLLSCDEFRGEVRQLTKDKKELIVEGRATLVRRPDGSPYSVLIINTDITEHKKLETQLLRAQRLESIGTLASGVAHDLNNILAPIVMGSAILRRKEITSQDDEVLSLIESCAQRGSAIVRQVLTFARGADGDRLNLPVGPLIKDVAKIAGETFPKKISVRTRIAEPLWTVIGDPTQLHQVLLNLCVNARDAMQAGGTLTLTAENFPVDDHYASMTPGAKAGPHVRFEVTDTGMGIPPQNLEKIFDPFFTTKELGHGTGLGLSSVIGIVKSHGGFMSVYSEVGRGTTFKVFLPATTEAEMLQETSDAVVPPAQGELLLLVDDERPILQIGKALLEGHGYQILTAEDAAEALAIFAKRMDEIGLVLTDLSMPVMDGIALIRTLRKMKPDIPVIASTGRGGQEQHSQELEELNIHACLTKPYNKETLLSTLHDALHART